MFQRIKGAIDSRIAEEIERQKATAATTPVARTSSTRRSISRTESPAGSKPRRPKPKDDGLVITTRGPDPSEFENNFVIEDEPEEKTTAEAPTTENTEAMGDANEKEAGGPGEAEKGEKSATPSPRPSSELPTEIRTKLRKLEKLEARYQELLRSYRIAHARAVSIEPFEKALKENTPLATISDPDALVEYLNQLNQKGNMVMDEYKKVSAEKETYKKKFEDSEKEAAAAREESAALKASASSQDAATENADTISIDTPTASVKSPTSSVLRMFSPKQKAVEPMGASEEFFSYDEEIPKLQAEVNEKTSEIEELKSTVSKLETELATVQESSSGLVESLEKATRELNASKDAVAEGQTHQEKVAAQTEEIKALKEKLETTENQLKSLEADLGRQKAEAETKFTLLQTDFTKHKDTSQKVMKSQMDSRGEAESLRDKLATQVKALEESKVSDVKQITELQEEVKVLKKEVEEAASHEAEEPAATSEAAPTVAATGGAKKKNNKKKKKGPNAAVITKDAPPTPESIPATPVSSDLEAEVAKLKEEIADRDVQITRLQTKRKTEEDLREQLETVEESLVDVGQLHMAAKDKIKDLETEKASLQERISELEKELEKEKANGKNSEKIEAGFKLLTAEFEDLKSKSAALQTDLGAAQQLATSRYRDLTDLKDVLQKAQPELKTLRAENAALKSTKDELATRTSELRRLEAREKDLKSDIASFKKQASDSQSEIRTLNEKVTQETNGRLRAEDQTRIAQRDMRRSDAEKIQLSASLEKANLELTSLQTEAAKLRPRVKDLEDQVQKLTTESKGLRDEVSLRGDQYNNAQGLLSSMHSQASELTQQLREAQSATSSLEEELSEVQRLLSERTREGETMRRLLADVDDRADAKVREMRERMEAAIEERDRAEDEASTNGRRRAREVDELKNKIRDFERDVKRAIDEKDELERKEKEWKKQRDQLESSSEGAVKEAEEVRAAMNELRAALDGSEKQVRDAEKQRADLRRILDEANQRYDKLQKEFRLLQAKQNKVTETSGRSSFDSGRGQSNGGGKPDFVYLKTILLQFIQQKDKKVQGDLIKTVLGQLLQFDKKDQEKWIAAISAK